VFKLGDLIFGDHVRIVDAEPTRRSGYANMVGVCYGLTTPSVTHVEVVGDDTSDVALNVHFEHDGVSDAWFAPDLVVLVEHAVGSRATVGTHSFVKGDNGEWIKEGSSVEPTTPRRRWFRR
jgi:hypothetical protein